MKYTDFYKFGDEPQRDSVDEISDETVEDSFEEVEETIDDEEIVEEDREVEDVNKDWVGYVSLPNKDMTLNLRSEPNSDSEVLSTLKNSTELIVSGEVNMNWYKVFTSSGIEGYVMKEFVKK